MIMLCTTYIYIYTYILIESCIYIHIYIYTVIYLSLHIYIYRLATNRSIWRKAWPPPISCGIFSLIPLIRWFMWCFPVIYIYAHIGHMLLIYAVIYGETWGSNLLHLIPADEWWIFSSIGSRLCRKPFSFVSTTMVWSLKISKKRSIEDWLMDKWLIVF